MILFESRKTELSSLREMLLLTRWMREPHQRLLPRSNETHIRLRNRCEGLRRPHAPASRSFSCRRLEETFCLRLIPLLPRTPQHRAHTSSKSVVPSRRVLTVCPI